MNKTGTSALCERGKVPRRQRPGERWLEPVVAPEQLFADDEAGRAEDAAADRLLAAHLEPGLVVLAMGPLQPCPRLLAQRADDRGDHFDCGQVAVLGEIGVVDRPGEGRSPALR